MPAPLIPLVPLTEDAATCEGGLCALPGAAPAPKRNDAPTEAQDGAEAAPSEAAKKGPS